jgi:tetratricopeptide (TPR) repeat protein
MVPIGSHRSASAQEPAQPPLDDSARIDQMFKECGESMRKGEFDDLLKKAEGALLLSRKLDDKARQARALNYVGIVRFHQTQFEEAAQAWKQAASLFGQADDKGKQIDALIYSSGALQFSGLYEDAHDTLTRALFICREVGDKKNEAQILMHIGVVYERLGEYDRAESSFQFVLRAGRELKQPSINSLPC